MHQNKCLEKTTIFTSIPGYEARNEIIAPFDRKTDSERGSLLASRLWYDSDESSFLKVLPYICVMVLQNPL